MHGTNDGVIEGKEQAMSKNREYTEEVYGQKEQEELKESYKQSLANRKERVEKKYPERPITGKEWIEGYRKWKKENEAYKADEDYKKILKYSIQMKAKKLLDEIE
jgi:hypothetical protein